MAPNLKNFFGKDVVSRLARDLAQVHPSFHSKRFTRECLDGLDHLELLGRAWHIAEALRRHLPADFPTATRILIASLDEENEAAELTGMASFRYLPHVLYVSKYGVDNFAEHFEPAMAAQYELTKRFTAEFSIRAYLEKYPQATLERLRFWALDANVHVRRLVSEGTRPRLPWAPRLRAFQKDPAPVIELLELLKNDPELYVRRSVANNLNDIAKDHPAIAVEVCRRWCGQSAFEHHWIAEHALRSLVKQGHPGALDLLGVGAKPKVKISDVRFSPKRPAIGGELGIEFTLSSASEKHQTLQVDYRVHFVKANGKTAPKVFKLRRLELEPRKSVKLATRVSFKPMTTRKHYPGIHPVDALINGIVFPLGEVGIK